MFTVTSNKGGCLITINPSTVQTLEDSEGGGTVVTLASGRRVGVKESRTEIIEAIDIQNPVSRVLQNYIKDIKSAFESRTGLPDLLNAARDAGLPSLRIVAKLDDGEPPATTPQPAAAPAAAPAAKQLVCSVCAHDLPSPSATCAECGAKHGGAIIAGPAPTKPAATITTNGGTRPPKSRSPKPQGYNRSVKSDTRRR